MLHQIPVSCGGAAPRFSGKRECTDCDKVVLEGPLSDRNRENGGNRLRRNAMVLALAMVAGCDATINPRPGGARILSGFEMDQVTAGSAVAANDAAARGFSFAPKTQVLGIASVYSGKSPIAGTTILDYANSQTTASRSGSNFAQTSISSQVAVDGGNGGASVDAWAAATGVSQAQVTAQFYGISTNRTDFVFGSVAAGACCGSDAAAGVEVASTSGGSYTREVRSAPVSATPGQVQNRVDIAVASSQKPLLDSAQVLAAGAPAQVSPKY